MFTDHGCGRGIGAKTAKREAQTAVDYAPFFGRVVRIHQAGWVRRRRGDSATLDGPQEPGCGAGQLFSPDGWPPVRQVDAGRLPDPWQAVLPDLPLGPLNGRCGRSAEGC